MPLDVSPKGKNLSPIGKTVDRAASDNGGVARHGAHPTQIGKRNIVSIQQYEATQRSTPIRHHQDQHERSVPRQTPRDAGVAIMTAAVAIVPAAFWASITWLLWGTLAAAIMALVVLIVTVLTLGLLRSAVETETPEAAPLCPELRHAA